MADLEIIDTFGSFEAFWQASVSRSPREQAQRWIERFRADWPDLCAKVEAGYAADGEQWQTVLTDRVFPSLSERVPVMARTRAALLSLLGPVYRQAERRLNLNFAVVVVILPTGWGGWATTHNATRAILLGLNTLVELGWTQPDAVRGLISHEVGHLLHAEWREREGLAGGRGPWWHVYAEGLAQRCESLVAGDGSFHMQHGQPGWLEWCSNHLAWLAREYVRTVEAHKPVYPFFGSYPEMHVRGRQMCGYFLGHEIIRRLQHRQDLTRVACLGAGDVDRLVKTVLQDMASSTSSTTATDLGE